MSGNLRGSAFMVLSMLAFAVEDALYKLAIADLPRGLSLILFGLVALALCAGLSWRVGEPVWTAAFLRPGLVLRSGVELAGRLFYALSLAFVPLATTSAILQATPLAVVLGAALVFWRSGRVAPLDRAGCWFCRCAAHPAPCAREL